MLISASIIDAEVPSYNIICDQNEFDNMILNWDEEIEINCTVEKDGALYQNVRMRIRGDSSRRYPKKSFRITFSITQPLDSRQKWNFNAEYLDRSYMHSYLFAFIMSRLDYPCFSVDYARMYVNDEYRGLYMRTAPYDSLSLVENSLDPECNLYKASMDGSCLSAYDNVEEVWTKASCASSGWNDLYQLIEDLDTLSSDNYLEFAAERFDMNDLLTIIAVNWLTSNFSTYYHNYYLYHDVWNTGMWTMLPWDVDKTFDSYEYGLYTWGANINWPDNPLVDKLLLNDYLLALAFQRLDEICLQVFNTNTLFNVIDSLAIELEDAVSEDTYDDIADIDEFYEAIEILKYVPIEQRPASLHGQYDDCPRPFATTSNQTCASPDLFASWNHAFDPDGDPVTYTLRVRRFPIPGHPDSTMVEYTGLTDTCITISGLPAGNYAWDVKAVSTWRYTVAFNQYMPFTVVLDYTALSGTLSGQTFLTSANSPYIINGDILIPSGSTVSIEQGTVLRFNEDCSVICQGNLYAEGSPGDSVVFCANMENKPWGGIMLTGGEAEFTYTVFSGSDGFSAGSQYRACIESDKADLIFESCFFGNNRGCLHLSGGTVYMNNCDLTGWNSAELFYIKNGKSATILNSSFGNMTNPPSSHHDGVEFQDCLTGEYLVKNCEVFNIEGDAFDANSSTLILKDNRVWNVEDKGFSIGIGAVGSEISNVTLTGNIVTDCYTAIAVKDGSFAEITDCTICNCDIGVRAYRKTTGSTGGNATVTNSIFDSNSTVFSIENGSILAVSYSLTGRNEPWAGEGNIANNPEFAGWGDYHLSYNSPCIDTGSPLIEDPDGTISDMGAVFFPQIFDGLVINEIQSVNDNTVADSYGEYDDWFEIYNGSGYDCDLSWVYMSDDPCDLAVYQFPPGTTVPSGSYLVVWADEHQWQSGCHLPFRLSGNGDSLYLSRQPAGSQMDIITFLDSDAPRLIDFKYFGAIPPDVSFGRIPDGGAEWSILEFCTPGWSNSIPHVDTGYLQVSNPFPNPVFSSSVTLDITVDAGQTVVSVYDLAGRLVDVIMDRYLETGEHRLHWDTLQGWGGYVPTGVYLIHVRHAAGLSESRKIVILNE
ncbi:MAG: CotH kinase family protein [Candidatus Aegiribacteria sp.]|nr:CotH kinase family protein [Candidatus Aegiribacteria sp.]